MCNNKNKTITLQQKADIETVFSAADALNNVFECLYKIGLRYNFPPAQQESISDAVDELQNIAFQLATWIYDPAAESAPEIVADKEKEMQVQKSKLM